MAATETRVALVTGAGSGIGRAAARALDRDGWHLVLAGRRGDALEETASGLGRPADVISVDLAPDGAGAGVIQMIEAGHGRLDALVHAAGHACITPLAQADRDLLRGYMRVHVEAALDLVTAGWDMLVAADPGRVVLISSMSAHDPFAGLGVYGMAKAAQEALARAISVDSGGAIGGASIAAGCVDTPMLRGLVPDSDARAALDPMAPETFAEVILDVLAGHRDADSTGTIFTDGP